MIPSTPVTRYDLQEELLRGYNAILDRLDQDLHTKSSRQIMADKHRTTIADLLDTMAIAFEEATERLRDNAALDKQRSSYLTTFSDYQAMVAACLRDDDDQARSKPTSKRARNDLNKLRASLRDENVVLDVTKAWLRVKLLAVVIWGNTLDLS